MICRGPVFGPLGDAEPAWGCSTEPLNIFAGLNLLCERACQIQGVYLHAVMRTIVWCEKVTTVGGWTVLGPAVLDMVVVVVVVVVMVVCIGSLFSKF